MMRDKQGNEIVIGCKVLYAMGYRHDVHLYTGRVVELRVTSCRIDSEEIGSSRIVRLSSDVICIAEEQINKEITNQLGDK